MTRRERIINNVLAFLCALMIGALMVATVVVSALIGGLA